MAKVPIIPTLAERSPLFRGVGLTSGWIGHLFVGCPVPDVYHAVSWLDRPWGTGHAGGSSGRSQGINPCSEHRLFHNRQFGCGRRLGGGGCLALDFLFEVPDPPAMPLQPFLCGDICLLSFRQSLFQDLHPSLEGGELFQNGSLASDGGVRRRLRALVAGLRLPRRVLTGARTRG